MSTTIKRSLFLSTIALAAMAVVSLAGNVRVFAQTEAAQQISVGFEGTGETVPQAEALAPGLTTDAEIAKLPTIEEVLGLVPETVCGTDTRQRITNTTTYPWRANCQLILTLPSGSKAIGSGFLIGRGTVATAGHCVHTGQGGGWMRKIEVIPGRNGTSLLTSRPYGTIVVYTSRLRTVTGWTGSSSPNYDYGAIILPTQIGNRTGWFGFGNYTDATLRSSTLHTAGYPGDKPTGTQWYTFGSLTSLTSRRLFYMFDTAGGQSGSVVYRIVSGSRFAVGIHAYGGCPNGATRIAAPVFTNLVTWRNQGGGP